jgi:hypothetical protein
MELVRFVIGRTAYEARPSLRQDQLFLYINAANDPAVLLSFHCDFRTNWQRMEAPTRTYPVALMRRALKLFAAEKTKYRQRALA